MRKLRIKTNITNKRDQGGIRHKWMHCIGWSSKLLINLNHTNLECAPYQIRKITGAHAPGILGTFPRYRFQRKPLVNDPGKHRGTRVTHVAWCMPGSLFRSDGGNVSGIPGACTTRDFTYLARGPFSNCVANASRKPEQIFDLRLPKILRYHCGETRVITIALIARFMGPTWGPSGADRTQVVPMLAPWTLRSGWPSSDTSRC